MTKVTKVFDKLEKDEVLSLLREGYEGLPITGAEEIDGEECHFYDANMWISNIETHGFNSANLYKRVEVKTIYHDNGEPQFSYLAFIIE